MAQTLWLNDRCNELIDQIMELEPAYSQKTVVVEQALESHLDDLTEDMRGE